MNTAVAALPKSGIVFPTPQIHRRNVDQAILVQAQALGVDQRVATVLAGRRLPPGTTVEHILRSRLADLDSPHDMLNMQRASERLAEAVQNGEHIALLGDYDPDGMTSVTLLYKALTTEFGHPPDSISTWIGHRLEDGYGITQSLVDRILANPIKVDVLVSADCGSCDEERIAQLQKAGVTTIVTDHHQLGAHGAPASAFAVVNPNQPGCQYGDKTICGAMVAWLLACATRTVLIQRGAIPDTTPSLIHYTDYLALGTVADCVSLGSKNNRAVVRAGLRRINDNARASWRAFRALQRDPQSEVTAETIAFGLAPRLNARTRLDDPNEALQFMLTDDDAESQRIALLLDKENAKRKEIESALMQSALVEASRQVSQGRVSLVVFLEEGHAGVQGICASRLVEAFGRPSIVLSRRPKTEEVVGSARGGDGFHVQQALLEVQQAHPGLIDRGGGHKAAGGVTIASTNVVAFAEAFEAATRRQLPTGAPGPRILTDGVLPAAEITMGLYDALKELEPYGREFDPPSFEGDFELADVQAIGDGTHLRLILRAGSIVLRGVWFRARRSSNDPVPVSTGEYCRVVFALAVNEFRSRRQVELRVIHATPKRNSQPKTGYL